MKDIKTILPVVLLIVFSLLAIIPTVSAELINTSEGVIITHYPVKFDKVGTIYRVDERGIVVDDIYFLFSSQVRFMTPQSDYSYLKSFKPGQKVGYLLNDENQITKLCLLLKAE